MQPMFIQHIKAHEISNNLTEHSPIASNRTSLNLQTSILVKARSLKHIIKNKFKINQISEVVGRKQKSTESQVQIKNCSFILSLFLYLSACVIRWAQVNWLARKDKYKSMEINIILDIITPLFIEQHKAQMFYVSDRQLALHSHTDICTLITTLSKLPKQRTTQQHEYVYKCLHLNVALQEIERKKSLNAKMQAVAHLTIEVNSGDAVKKDTEEKRVIVEELKLSQKENRTYLIILNKGIKQSIEKANQKYLRKNIEKLKQFIIFKDMKYHQLLHLAYYMQSAAFNYKEVIYREGDPPAFIYLVEKGQFQTCKETVRKQAELKKMGNSSDKNKKESKDIKSEIKIGIIQGSCGQCFGEQDILGNEKRMFTVKCISTENIVFKIPKERYCKIVDTSYTQTKMKWLQQKNGRKKELKNQFFTKILNTKNNYKNYTNMIIKNNDLIQSQANQHANSLDKKQRILTLHKNRSVSTQIQQKYSMKENLSLNKTLVNEERQSKDSVDINASQQEDNPFELTRIEESKYPPVEVEEKKGPKSKFPMINRKLKPYFSVEQQKISEQVVKNWSATRPALDLKGIRKKYSGLIDIGSLIKQKQSILSMKLAIEKQKLLVKQQSNEFFTLEYPEVNKKITQNFSTLNKKQTREMRSAVHSKNFMQNLLVDALKKSGYSGPDENSNEHELDIGRRKASSKLQKNRISKELVSNLSQQNAFDRYFKKLE